ncbi:MAG: 2-hydroxyacyl-CoA dehydratase [Candidatus Enterosoma sp.]|nr:2-hydroxyacyl-CoA dehydratase [Candidatus Enterosoma sp.]
MKNDKLKRDKTGRIIFTKKMKKEYTLLFPMMSPIHFAMLQKVFNHYGYHAELLTDTSPEIAQTGLKYIQNDMCYPAILSCGQMIHALQSGKYDLHHVALMITQTGGGCRASNYIKLLRKGLERAGLGFVPTISVNMSGLEPNPGMKITLPLIRRAVAAVIYGDLLMCLKNQVEPYEVDKGKAVKLTDSWIASLSEQMLHRDGYKMKVVKRNLAEITKEFSAIKKDGKKRLKVGIVGEIYVKYAALGNNNLEKFLRSEDCEVNLPGMMNFILFKIDNRIIDCDLYGGHRLKRLACKILFDYCTKIQNMFNDAIKNNSDLEVPSTYQYVKDLTQGVNGMGNRMGEGWLLTGEMLELADTGYENIVCTQPFGCLPNHISGKGMIRKVREKMPNANIVAVDYDAGAPKVNQENRIKLMLSIGKEKLEEE